MKAKTFNRQRIFYYRILNWDNQTKNQKDSSTQMEQKMKAMVGCPHERIYLKYKYEE